MRQKDAVACDAFLLFILVAPAQNQLAPHRTAQATQHPCAQGRFLTQDVFAAQPKQICKSVRWHGDLCWSVATQIVYTGFATPYCSVYVADASAARVQRLLCREAGYSLCVKKPSHFWIPRVLNRGRLELFLWYQGHQLCVAVCCQKLVHGSSVA